MREDDDRPGSEEIPVRTELPDLTQTLLHAEVAHDDKPGARSAYPLWGMLLATAFILFHASVLLVHNLPSKGLSKDVRVWFDKQFQTNRYFRATGNTQSWAMFAPNPHRSNIFMKIEVLDEQGQLWDLKHDIYGKRRYPYLWYDRRGKINRRIIDGKGYRRHYAAWVCRQWERTHGVLPEEVQFTKLWTRIPSPEELLKQTKGRPWQGYDPMKLHLNEREEDAVRCSSTRHAQLPNYLRARYGMEIMDDSHFRGMHIRTWVDIAEDKAEAEAAGDKTNGARSSRSKRKAKKR
ncbi:MAG: hypothetical protein JKY37_14010 [Nannocystaceae bacterium]|nr:hypothetical protein [Nannocystaceae bacterium]